MLVINEDDELDTILESIYIRNWTSLNQLTRRMHEQLDGSSQEKLGVGSAPAMDTSDNSGTSELAP